MILGGLFDVSKLEQEKKELEIIVNRSGFWDDVDLANKTYQQLKNINKILKEYNDLVQNVEILKELSEIEDGLDSDIESLSRQVEDLEIETLLSGEYDNLNCYLEIHPGAGGTESCDWASMLLRMYERFLEKNGYDYKVIDKQLGDEAGVKSVTIFVSGNLAYGYLKNEKGVHRLVRISPFDSNKRRHTSFASVNVTPEFDMDIQLDIKEELQTWGSLAEYKGLKNIKVTEKPEVLFARLDSEVEIEAIKEMMK